MRVHGLVVGSAATSPAAHRAPVPARSAGSWAGAAAAHVQRRVLPVRPLIRVALDEPLVGVGQCLERVSQHVFGARAVAGHPEVFGERDKGIDRLIANAAHNMKRVADRGSSYRPDRPARERQPCKTSLGSSLPLLVLTCERVSALVSPSRQYQLRRNWRGLRRCCGKAVCQRIPMRSALSNRQLSNPR